MTPAFLKVIGPEHLEAIFTAAFVAEHTRTRTPCVHDAVIAAETHALELAASVCRAIDWNRHLADLAPMAMLTWKPKGTGVGPYRTLSSIGAPFSFRGEWCNSNEDYQLTDDERTAIEKLATLRRRFDRDF